MKALIKKAKWLLATVLICVAGVVLGIGLNAKASQDKPAIEKIAVSLYDELAFHYYVSVPVRYTSPYMQFELDGKTYTETEAEKEGDYYVFTLSDINPQYLETKVTATLYAKKYGSRQQCDTYEKSIDAYCTELMQYTAEELGIIEEKYAALSDLIRDLRAYCAFVKQNAGVCGYLPYTFSVNSSVSMADAILKVTNQTTNEVFNVWDFQKQSESTYKVAIPIAPVECRNDLSIQLYVGGKASGKQVTYSLASYVTANQNQSTQEAKLAKLYYAYGVSAIKYGVRLSVEEIFDVAGASVCLQAAGGDSITRLFEDNHTLSLAGIAKGDYEIKMRILGVEKSLGSIKIDDCKIDYPVDVAAAFLDATSVRNGDLSYDFATSTVTFNAANAVTKVTAKSLMTEVSIPNGYSVTAKLTVDEALVLKDLANEKAVAFGINGVAEGKGDGISVVFHATNGEVRLRNWYNGQKNTDAVIGTYKVSDGVASWTPTELGKALIGEGLYIKYERDDENQMKLYAGTKASTMTLVDSWVIHENENEITQLGATFTQELDGVYKGASVQIVSVGIAQDVNVSLTGNNLTATGASFQFTQEVGTPITVVADANNKLAFRAEPGTYDITTKVFGIDTSLGTIKIKEGVSEYEVKLSKAFVSSTYSDSGDLAYDFASGVVTFAPKNAVSKATSKGLMVQKSLKGGFSVTTKIQVDEASVLKDLANKKTVAFGLNSATTGTADGISVVFHGTNGGVRLRNWFDGQKNTDTIIGTYAVSGGVASWTPTDLGKALVGDGLYIKYERDNNNQMKLYAGTSKETMTAISSWTAHTNENEFLQLGASFTQEAGGSYSGAKFQIVDLSVAQDTVVDLTGNNLTAQDASFTFTPTCGTAITAKADENNQLSFQAEPGIYKVTTQVFGVEASLGHLEIVKGVTNYEVKLANAFLSSTYLDNGDISYDFASGVASFHAKNEVSSVTSKNLLTNASLQSAFSITTKVQVDEESVLKDLAKEKAVAFGVNGITTGKADGISVVFHATNGKVRLRNWFDGQKNTDAIIGTYTVDDGVASWTPTDLGKALIGDGLYIKYERDHNNQMKLYAGATADTMVAVSSWVAHTNTNEFIQVGATFTQEVGGAYTNAKVSIVNVGVPQDVVISLTGDNFTAAGASFSLIPKAGTTLTATADAQQKLRMRIETGTYEVSAQIYGLPTTIGTVQIVKGKTEYTLDLSTTLRTLEYDDNNKAASFDGSEIIYDFATSTVSYQTGSSKYVQLRTPDLDLKRPFSVTAQLYFDKDDLVYANAFNFMMVLSDGSKSDSFGIMYGGNGKLRIRTGKYTNSSYNNMQIVTVNKKSLAWSAYNNTAFSTAGLGEALTGEGLWVKYECTGEGTVNIWAGASKNSMTKIHTTTYTFSDTLQYGYIQFHRESAANYHAQIKNITISQEVTSE